MLRHLSALVLLPAMALAGVAFETDPRPVNRAAVGSNRHDLRLNGPVVSSNGKPASRKTSKSRRTVFTLTWNSVANSAIVTPGPCDASILSINHCRTINCESLIHCTLRTAVSA